VGRGVGQKPLNQRTKTIKPRTKTIKPPPPYPSQVLERQGFQEGIFPFSFSEKWGFLLAKSDSEK
jgi:hypothetical protein